ncbi:MAG: response regulator [Proteobacteria bacterium]|nr:response regulator [Pseudomonadota bacterium]
MVRLGQGTMAKRKRAVKKAAKKAVRKRAGRPVRKTPALPPVRAIEAALAGIAHDIRTPLTGIVALAELLASSELGPRERDWAQAVKSGADHLAQLASLIVDAVRADAKGLVLRDEPFSPKALAETVGEALAARAGNKAVSATTTIAPTMATLVSGDALRLRAALENLADNAVKFTHDGSIAFNAHSEPAARGPVRLVFTFTDSGVGLSAVELKRLFKPFAQANEDVARRYGGAGLGLVFVRRVARAMGGDLTVTSKPGKGSTFTFTAQVKPVARHGPRNDTRGAGTQPRTLSILCAEDNPFGRVVLSTILKELGHRVDFVGGGEAAVQAAARGAYDAVLMDLVLPDIDGFEATRRIRALPDKAAAIPVIGISGHDDGTRAAAARAAGMNFYLTKPVSPLRLAEALARLPSPRMRGEMKDS